MYSPVLMASQLPVRLTISMFTYSPFRDTVVRRDASSESRICVLLCFPLAISRLHEFIPTVTYLQCRAFGNSDNRTPPVAIDAFHAFMAEERHPIACFDPLLQV